MLTNNYYKSLQCCMTGKSVSGVTTTSGDTNSAYPSSYCFGEFFSPFLADYMKKVVTSTNSKGVAFGTGTTAPSRNDYWLSGDLITTISVVAATITSSVSNEAYNYNCALTISNTGDADISIGEVALVGYVYKSSNSPLYAMLDRLVLDTPLTLAAGEQGVITYNFNLPIVQ